MATPNAERTARLARESAGQEACSCWSTEHSILHSPPGERARLGRISRRLDDWPWHAPKLQRSTFPLPFRVLRSFNPARSTIQRTPHTQSRLLHHMRINLRGAHVLVPE